MLSDPRIGLGVSLAVVAAGLAWLAGQALAADLLFARLGYAMHAATLLAIFAVLAGAAVAALFGRYAEVRAELLQGRRVLATWRVDADTLARFAPLAVAADDRDKRGALILVWVLLAVVFGAFAVYDPEAAAPMLAIAAVVAAATGLAYLAGRRTARTHWRMRDGAVIVGERGVLFNGVLHVWALPLGGLAGVARAERPPALLVSYRFWTRLGPQVVTVPLPVPATAAEAARRAEAGLAALLHDRRR